MAGQTTYQDTVHKFSQWVMEFIPAERSALQAKQAKAKGEGGDDTLAADVVAVEKLAPMPTLLAPATGTGLGLEVSIDDSEDQEVEVWWDTGAAADASSSAGIDARPAPFEPLSSIGSDVVSGGNSTNGQETGGMADDNDEGDWLNELLDLQEKAGTPTQPEDAGKSQEEAGDWLSSISQ